MKTGILIVILSLIAAMTAAAERTFSGSGKDWGWGWSVDEKGNMRGTGRGWGEGYRADQNGNLSGTGKSWGKKWTVSPQHAKDKTQTIDR